MFLAVIEHLLLISNISDDGQETNSTLYLLFDIRYPLAPCLLTPRVPHFLPRNRHC